MIRRRFTDKDFENNNEFISMGDLKPLVTDIFKEVLKDEMEGLIKTYLDTHIFKKGETTDDFKWEYSAYQTLTNNSKN